jgi:cyclopropane-fatty-acyl-phospholipid synthase
MTEGQLTVIDAAGVSHVFAGRPGPAVTVRLHNRALHHRLLLNPKLAVGEAYMDGTLTIEDASLYDLIDLLARNLVAFENRPSRRFVNAVERAVRIVHTYNPVPRAHRNVAHHYDYRERFMTCSWIVIGNIPVPISLPRTKRSSKRRRTRNCTSPPSCC